MNSNNRRLRAFFASLTLAILSGTHTQADVLINLDATSLPLGGLPSWTNTGTVGGTFTATGAPAITTVNGVNAVTFAGSGDFFAGPASPPSVTGVNPSRSIEVWAFNPTIESEETLVGWGRRGGPDGTNMAFNYGTSGAFGAVGHWGGQDIGWYNAGGAPTAGQWHYLVYTYDGGGAAGVGTTRVYSDGVLLNTEVAGNLNTHAGFPFVIGGQNNDAGTPAGFNATLSIGRVRVHNVTLSDAQIAGQFATEFPQFFTQATVTSARVQGENFVFQVTDAPSSVVNPNTFSIVIPGVTPSPGQWAVEGGEGVVNGSITSPEITIPAAGTATLSFQHRFNFELDQTQANAYDGGIVQVSINGGPFLQIGDSSFTQNGYTHEGGIAGNPLLTIIGTGDLLGLNAFNGPSGGFITSIATIPSIVAGDTVRVRFFGAWDEGYTSSGPDWEIRSVTVTSGVSTLINANFAAGSSGGFTTSGTALGSTWTFSDGTGSETKSYDFNSGLALAGTVTSGVATLTGDGGVGDTAAMQLTDGLSAQTGSFFINDPAAGFTLKSMAATFKVKLTGVTATPGEGFSFVWANNINDTAFGEEGIGNGLVVSFDTHDNGGAEAPAIDVKWNGAVLQHTPVSAATLFQPGFVPVAVTVHSDASVSVSFNGATIANHLPLPGFIGMSGGRFAWGARTTATFGEAVLLDDINLSLPRSGALTASKTGAVTTFTFPVRWSPSNNYGFTLTGKDTDNDDLIITGVLDSPYLPRTLAGFPTGFEGSLGQWAVREYRQGPFAGFGGAVAIASNGLLVNLADGVSPVMSYSDTNGHPPSIYNLPYLTNDGSGNNDNIVVVGKTQVYISSAGDYTFYMRTDDGFGLKVSGGVGGRFTAASSGNIDPQDNQTVAFRDYTGDSNTKGVYHFDGPGVYDLLFIAFEGGGGSGWQVSWAPGDWVNNTGNAIFLPVGNLADPSLPPLATAQNWPSSVPGPRGENGKWGVRTYLNNGIYNSEDLASVLNVLAFDTRTPATAPGLIFDTQEATLNFEDPNNARFFATPPPRPFPGNTPAGDDHVVSIAHGSIRILEEDNYTFNVHSDDGFFLRIRSTDGSANPTFYAYGGAGTVDLAAANIMYFPSGTGDSDTRGAVHLRAGTYNLEFVTWEGGGGFFYQVFAARGQFLTNESTSTWAPIGLVAPASGPVSYPSLGGKWTVESTLPGGLTSGSIVGADSAVSAAVLADSVAATSLWDIINFNDLGPGAGVTGRIPGDVEWPRGIPGVNDDNYAIRMRGTLHIPETGDYQIGYDGDDGSAITISAGSQYFDPVLVENATGAGVEIHTTTLPPVNSGSLAPGTNMTPNTAVQFNQAGAIVGDPRTAVTIPLAAEKLSVPFTPSLNPSGSFSVEAWLKPARAMDPANANDLTCAFSSGHFASPRTGWLIYQSNAGWNFRTYNSNGTAFVLSITGGGPPTVGNWYHVVATWDGIAGEAKIYVNGVLGATSAPGLPFVANVDGDLRVGERSDGAFDWQGDADEVAVYPSVLGLTTIIDHYENGENSGRTTTYPNLVLASNPLVYYKLDELNTPINLTTTTLKTDVATGSTRTVGRIHLTAGDYPISGIFWEAGGGSSFEIFATRELSPGVTLPFQPLKNGGFPPITFASGLPLVTAPPPSLALANAFVRNGNNSFSLRFLSEQGSMYALESTTDLVTWVEIADSIVGTGGYVTITGTPPPAPLPFLYFDPLVPKQFFRIKRVP